MTGLRVGIDIGGTTTDAVAIDDDGRVVHLMRFATGFGPDAVLATAVAAVEALAGAAAIAPGDFVSIGIGIPGAVDVASGRVEHAVNLGVPGLDLGGELARRLGRGVGVENDVNAAALGAFSLLGRTPANSMAYLNLGTGLAAGLVLEGRLWRGSGGVAGEIGHIPVDPAGPVCRCGQHGCLELMASGSAVARLWPTDDPNPVRSLFDAADAGDARARSVRERLVANVAAAVRLLVLTVDVDDVVIGGGLTSLGAALLDEVRRVLQRWESDSEFLVSLRLPERVTLVPAGTNAAAIGAALIGTASIDSALIGSALIDSAGAEPSIDERVRG